MSFSALTGWWCLEGWCSGWGFGSILVDCLHWTPWTDQFATWLPEGEEKRLKSKSLVEQTTVLRVWSSTSVFRVILPLRVWTEVEIWSPRFSEFLLCQVSFCFLCCHRFYYCWWYNQHTSLQTTKTHSWKHFLWLKCSTNSTHTDAILDYRYFLKAERNDHALVKATELIVTRACGWWNSSVGWRLVRELEWFLRAWEVL